VFYHRLDQDVELRLLEERHAKELFALTDRNRAYLREWLPWLDNTISVADTRRFIQASLEQFANNNGFTAGIWYRGQLAGLIGLQKIDWANRSTNIGYWLGAAYQGRGLMTKACQALVDFAFTDLGLNHVEIRCAPENKRSRAIPERLGFRQEGLLRQAEWLYDHFVDHVVYGLLASEYKKK
jgi:ribosomal-protein-serine acetyltransferase